MAQFCSTFDLVLDDRISWNMDVNKLRMLKFVAGKKDTWLTNLHVLFSLFIYYK
ncbi:hypothetical protein Hdeb2414_s0852g00954381 [Helianthus debilis subsp. tardiflorus]